MMTTAAAQIKFLPNNFFGLFLKSSSRRRQTTDGCEINNAHEALTNLIIIVIIQGQTGKILNTQFTSIRDQTQR